MSGLWKSVTITEAKEKSWYIELSATFSRLGVNGSSKTEIGCGWNICQGCRATSENAFLITAHESFARTLFVVAFKSPRKVSGWDLRPRENYSHANTRDTLIRCVPLSSDRTEQAIFLPRAISSRKLSWNRFSALFTFFFFSYRVLFSSSLSFELPANFSIVLENEWRRSEEDDHPSRGREKF